MLGISYNKEHDYTQGGNGDKRTEGCLQSVCKDGVWRPSLANNLCCYEGTPYSINNTISSSMSEDGCARASLECVEDTTGRAKIALNIKNNCDCQKAEKDEDKEPEDVTVEGTLLGLDLIFKTPP